MYMYWKKANSYKTGVIKSTDLLAAYVIFFIILD